jgi:hypothetical protein
VPSALCRRMLWSTGINFSEEPATSIFSPQNGDASYSEELENLVVLHSVTFQETKIFLAS